MISNPAFLFGFYSRRVITGRKPYKRLPGNDGKDVTFHIKTTLIPPQTSKTPFLPNPSHRCHQPPFPLGVWGPPPPHKEAATLLCRRLGGKGPWGEGAGSPSPSPPVPPRQGRAGQAGQPREGGRRQGRRQLRGWSWSWAAAGAVERCSMVCRLAQRDSWVQTCE